MSFNILIGENEVFNCVQKMPWSHNSGGLFHMTLCVAYMKWVAQLYKSLKQHINLQKS